MCGVETSTRSSVIVSIRRNKRNSNRVQLVLQRNCNENPFQFRNHTQREQPQSPPPPPPPPPRSPPPPYHYHPHHPHRYYHSLNCYHHSNYNNNSNCYNQLRQNRNGTTAAAAAAAAGQIENRNSNLITNTAITRPGGRRNTLTYTTSGAAIERNRSRSVISMPSSFPKHHCLHRIITFIAASLVTASFVIIMRKDCRLLPIEDDSGLWAAMVNNQTLQYAYIEHYYDDVQIYHLVIVCVDLLIFLLAFLNLAPAQEDIRFGFHLLLIITLGALTILACYTAYVSFGMPCHAAGRIADRWTNAPQVYLHSAGRHQAKGTPITAYGELDYHMLLVTVLDAAAFSFFTISTIVLCFDAREEAIQDEYVARVRASIY